MENTKPTGMRRASHWSTEVENAYRFQLAGYRDEVEYFVSFFVLYYLRMF